MPLRKISDWNPLKICAHPEHNPPGHIVLDPGTYEYECPGCGRKITFVISPTFLDSSNEVTMKV